MTYIKLLLTAFFWGGTFIAGRMIAGKVDPLNAAFLRFLIASVFLLVVTKHFEGHLPKVSKGQMVSLVLLGATGIFSYNLFFFSGLNYIGAGKASLIIAINPVCISLLSALIFKETLNTVKSFGILISVTGALIVISNGNITAVMGSGFGRGELLILGCVGSWVAYSLIGKTVMGRLSPLVSVCYSSILGTLMLLLPVLFNGSLGQAAAYSAMDWLSLFYLGFFGTVLGFFWYYEGIKNIGPMKASVFINFVPVSAIFLAYFLLDEAVSLTLLAGAVLVISGVYMANASEIIRKMIKSGLP